MQPLVRIKTFVERYQHELSIGSFVVGFTLDTILLKRIDLLVSNALLITYLTVALTVIMVLHGAAGRAPRPGLSRVLSWLPFVAQFAFGGMFSGFLIFYSQSGSVISSWPFLTIILGLIIANEYLRTYQSRLTYQATLLFFCLFSFSIYAVPIFLGRMGDSIFELSGFVALVGYAGVLALLYFIDARRLWASITHIVLLCVGVYALVTTLYFANVLPPIPLALKDIGVYYNLERAQDGYVVEAEPEHWYDRVVAPPTLTLHAGSPLFAYTSIFAPTSLSTQVVHRWERSVNGTWVTVSTVPFGIVGGRDGGYRGYSELPITAPGSWRVSAETTRGQLIGRERFNVRFGSTQGVVTRILD